MAQAALEKQAPGFQGPLCWLLSGSVGVILGAVVGLGITGLESRPAAPEIPLWLVLPFVFLLGSMALTPLFFPRFWARHYPDFALFLGGAISACYLLGLGSHGREKMGHAAVEYFQFIALVGGLYILSGGILIEVRGPSRPWVNTALLAVGAVLANVLGTTGAAMLLLRPFLRLNQGRIKAFHVVFFIFIVANCGGLLTPIGDPPLFMGYLKGVPFTWTITNLWPQWLFVNGLLLTLFFLFDWRCGGHFSASAGQAGIGIKGGLNLFFLLLFIASILLDSALKELTGRYDLPFGALLQAGLAGVSLRFGNREIRQKNEFTFHPLQEVAFLFFGIFATMVPALSYLEQSASRLGLQTPAAFYFATGALSALLDNAPTYLCFLQLSFGLFGLDLNPANFHEFLSATHLPATSSAAPLALAGRQVLAAISTGAVFFGALTYIGNGPNFMVKAIAESAGVKMPSFLGYMGYSLLLLLPILGLNWWLLGMH